MKKLLVSALAAVGLMAGSIGAAQAATAVSGAFNVTVTLASVCTITTPTNVAFGTYTSFQAGAINSTGGQFDIKCTNGLTPTLSYTGTPVGGTLTASGGTFTSTNLAYTLGIGTTGGAAAATGAVTVSAGNGALQTYFINGTMAGSQGGTCASTTCADTISGSTLTLTY